MGFASSFGTLLTILFIGLKLAGIGVVATWSWWWVLSPIWIGPLFMIVFFLFLLAGILAGRLIEFILNY